MKPVLLLDVDGVLNTDLPGWPGGYIRANVTAAGAVRPVRWSPAALGALVNLDHCGLADLVWCSSWCAHIHILEELWELPRFERAFTHPVDSRRAQRKAKYDAALRVVEDGRPLIWVDDEDIPTAGPLRDALLVAGPACLIVPHSTYGVTPHHLDRITGFITTLGEGER